ncbi:MAG: hypothetical protein C0434_07855 [Xanthomonadaceae bacterium]|nr:hypothetical protein [Xanthomonadaceae bacterium]
MSDKMREALTGLLKLAEVYSVKIDGEWGAGRSLAEIEADGDLEDEIVAAREALAQAEQRGEVIPQYRRRGAIEWYDGYADHEDSCGPYEERVVYTAPVVPDGVLTRIDFVLGYCGARSNRSLSSEAVQALTEARAMLAAAPEVPRG